jgi:Ca2+-binding RTX toxin-like protein
MQLTNDQLDFLEIVIAGDLTSDYIISLADVELYNISENLVQSGLLQAKPKAAFYLALADMTDGQPGVDVAVTLWLRGASEVNSGVGSQSDLIRAYNKAQSEARSGTAVSDATMDMVSNNLALRVLQEIKEADGLVPDLNTIAISDASEAAKLLFGGSDLSGWAGNPLFLALGHDASFRGNIIGSNEDNGAYDVLSMIKFLKENVSVFSNTVDAITQFASYPNAFPTITSAVSDLETFLQNHYGESNGAILQIAFSHVILGQLAQNEEISGNESSNYIHAADGDDTISFSEGSDLIDGGQGSDTFTSEGLSGPITFAIDSRLDRAADYVGDYVTETGVGVLYSIERLVSGGGDDLFYFFGDEQDTLIASIDAGGNGDFGDTASFLPLSPSGENGVDVSLAQGLATFGDQTISLVNFEHVIGTHSNDFIVGDDGGNQLSGADGSDVIFGGEGNDTISGGDGADELNGGAGDDRIIIDADDTVVTGGEGRDAVYVSGEAGVALDMSANGVEIFVGGAGNDTVSSLLNPNELVILAGGAGNDELILEHEEFNLGDPLPDRGPVIMMGGAGADAFIGTGGAVMVINANLTEDNIANLTMSDLRAAFSQVDWLEISAVIINADSSDRFEFSEGQGAISASTGNGFFIPQYWNTRLQGQSYVFSDNLSNLDPTDPASGFFGTDRNNPDHYESGGPSGTGWTIFGASLSGTTISPSSINVVFDTEDDDILLGGELDDRFAYSGGSNTYAGGGGTNTVGYGRSGVSTVTINLATGSGTIESTSGTAIDTYEQIQNVSGSFGGDSITGNAVANELSGGEGADIIAGGAGNDTLYGGEDNDVLTGGTGSDVFAFDAGDGDDEVADFDIENDLIVIDGQLIDPATLPFDVAVTQVGENVVLSYGGDPFSGAAGDEVTLLNVSLDEWINGPATETILGTEANNVINQSYIDENGVGVSDSGQLILAGGGRDNIYDGAGNDTVDGGDGRDRFYAGDGADNYIGGADRDEIFYSTSTTGLVIDMINSANSTGIAAGDTYSGVEYLHGSNFDDTIVATTDLVFGRAGNDVIQDADGQQRMFGGAGSDTFRFVDGDNDRDRISDFELGVDMIDLSLWGVTSLNDAGLVIEERTNGQGNLQGDLVITFNGNNNYIRIDHLDTADIAALDESHFIFA